VKKFIAILLVAVFAFSLVGCTTAADTASYNTSQAADNFEVYRRVVMFNGITDKYLLVIEGRLSITADTVDDQLEVVVKTGPNEYKKHFLGLSDNVSYFVEQMEASPASEYHYRVFFRPQQIVPDIDLQVDPGDLPISQP
jgi:uncharacterized lipoprotein NlpE involved in copper resistance